MLAGTLRSDERGRLLLEDKSGSIDVAPPPDLDAAHLNKTWIVPQFCAVADFWTESPKYEESRRSVVERGK